MRRYSICLPLLFVVLTTHAQVLRQPISAVYTGLGAYSTQHTDVFSFNNNQAALAQIKNTSFGVYGERRFMLSATTAYNASIAIPSTLGNFGVSMKRFGDKSFNENQLGLAYARSLGPKIDLGVQFNYYDYRVPGYQNDNTLNAEIGIVAHLTDNLNAGVHVYNPVGGKFSKTDEKLSSVYTFGLGYDASEQFFISAELVKEQDYPVNVNMGFQYRFEKIFFLRGGIATANSRGYAGAGISWSNLRLDVSGSYHPQLGFSPGLLLIVNLAKKDKTSTGSSNQ
ncbi:MAG TPA: hypothetical protein PKC39_08685 [Ferruginibacter sp.]|nr:hypothetical protein [Ferruginibacter sp.]HMP21020.1 hypothetical protein [Ferruginibacter sp.]